MAGLIVASIVVGFPLGLAALVRSLRLDDWKKAVFGFLSVLTLFLFTTALVSALVDLEKVFVRIFFYSGLGLGLITLSLVVYFIRKMHNKVFTDKTKEHRESVAKFLEEQKNEEENSQK